MALRSSIIGILCSGLIGTVVADQADERLITRSASLSSLYSTERAEAFSATLPVDREVRWRIFAPDKPEPAGVVVFISPNAAGVLPQPGWIEALEHRNLIWVAAEEFGNDVPTARRLLAAIMGLSMVRRDFRVDNRRIYVAGLSGGGRAASALITRFPRMFTGAIYMVGVDYWTSEQESLIEHIAQNRYVFLTGHDDFNRRETKQIYNKYREAGVKQVLLMDLPDFGHEYPNADQFARALDYLDTGMDRRHTPSDLLESSQ